MVFYLARTKATNFQRIILMGAKRHAKQNNDAYKTKSITKSTSKINTLLVTPYYPALLYWHNLSVLYKAKIVSV